MNTSETSNLNALLSLYGMMARFLEIAVDAAKCSGDKYTANTVSCQAIEKANDIANIIGGKDAK